MIHQPPPFGLERTPAPAWARTVVERRLLWLAKCHPRMDPRKRHEWGLSAFRADCEGTKP
jgi:hypothetical protein